MASGIRAFHPVLGELPAEIPVFPLSGAMLLPGGRLPLNIFEPRYLAMVEDALAGGRMFGMIQPDSLKPGDAKGPGLFGIGCLGRVTSFAETEDGRLAIALLGVTRFAATEEVEMRRGYRRLRVSYEPFAQDLQETDEGIGLPRQGLLASLRLYFDRQKLTADWDAINELDDQTLLTSLCMMCPFSPSEKQALLEADTLTTRAMTLATLLEFGQHQTDSEGSDPRFS
ncbi:LON peptidase substrate-binding domain-containing protein [Acidisoma silvae]|uniref:LON peptidase substrate-binding domain-containing protein n=1 Tax=Acidisoma silvae TaxID=2802396 RepID=A0A963YQ47_9PROT|nr:LON peptidase substrate-binding domain-containing protein [Acidisoma silvae]MCB8874870.1 LON peptidase substrate-binding domain-containing protein [Acidisoma silvae]